MTIAQDCVLLPGWVPSSYWHSRQHPPTHQHYWRAPHEAPTHPQVAGIGTEGAATVDVYWKLACCPSLRRSRSRRPSPSPSPEPKPEPEPEPEPKSKSKPVGGSAMLAVFVRKHAPSEASEAAGSSE